MSEKYILVVDDDPDLVETVAMMLESKGCEVGRAYDGVEGEESIRERRPDLVILDIMMPQVTGIDMLEFMQRHRDLDKVPVVMLSHLAREADVKRALGEINALDVVSSEAVLIRIEDQELD